MAAAEDWAASGDGVLFWLYWASDPGGRRLLMAAVLALAAWAVVRWLDSSGPQGLKPVGRLGARVVRLLGSVPVMILAVACALLPQVVAPMQRPDAGGKPTVVFILLDTVRLDHLGWGGAELDTSPRIDVLARDGAAFTQNISQAPWTKPSVAAMITGSIPGRTGATGRRGPLLPRNRTLAEAFASAGYRTHGLSSNPNIAGPFGFRQGFLGWYEDTTAWCDELIPRGVEWLAAGGDQPSLLYLHLNDAHYPYSAPDGYRGRFNHTGLEPELTGQSETEFRHSLGATFTPEEVEAMRLAYAEEIRWLDDQVGALVEELLATRDDVLVVITSDHGEEFLEHGDLGHGHALHEELIRIPLQFAWSPALGEKLGLVAGRHDGQVRQMDVMPTLLELAGLEWPEGAPVMDGISLAPILRGEVDEVHRPAFSETDSVGSPISGPTGPLRSWREEDWKLVETDPWAEDTAGRLWLYRLVADPGERRNLAPEERDRLAAMREALRDSGFLLQPGDREASNVALSAAEAANLAALGYAEDDQSGMLEGEPYLDPKAVPWLEVED
jgi:arylsulfatase A-like enzyme